MTQTLTCPDSDALKGAVRAIYRAICADFGDRFLAQFRAGRITPDAWQWRLYRLAGGVEIRFLLDGYEEARTNANGFPPTAASIADEAHALQRRHRRDESARRDAERIAALPPPNPAGMERIAVERAYAAESAAKREGESPAERMRRIIAMHRAHDALITSAEAAGRIRQFRGSAPHICAVQSCPCPGTISHSTTGGEIWYCRDHFRRW